MDPKKKGDSSPEGRIPPRVTSTPVTTHLQGISSELKKNLQTTKSREKGTYHATSNASYWPRQQDQETEHQDLGFKALPLLLFQLLFQLKTTVAPVKPVSRSSKFVTTMTTTKAIAEGQRAQFNETWEVVESGALKALAKIKFSTEDSELYPPLCKQHVWQQVLLQAVNQAARLLKDFPSFRLMHGLVSYTPMEAITFSMDAAYKSTQFSKEELVFLRKLRLEDFLCNVPWGVVHTVRAMEAIDTLEEDTMQVTLKGEVMPLFSANWRELFLKVFHLTPRGEGDRGENLQLQDLFPSLETV